MQPELTIALAGNPNVGKSTVFNALTGLSQHTGNWPGKTVLRAEGIFREGGHTFRLVDLPGTYSLLATSPDEAVARNFLLFGQPTLTLVVVEATRLERSLNLALQVLQITRRVVICLNLMDEAERNGITVNAAELSQQLGVPVVPTAARSGRGLRELRQTLAREALKPYRATGGESFAFALPKGSAGPAVEQITAKVQAAFPLLDNPTWVALRLLDGDAELLGAVRSGELLTLSIEALKRVDAEGNALGEAPTDGTVPPTVDPAAVDALLKTVYAQRVQLEADFHDHLMEAQFALAGRIADRVVTYRTVRPGWDRGLDALLTSRVWGFPIMLLLLAVVFWLTITGANYPSQWLRWLLVDVGHPLLSSAVFALGAPEWLRGLTVNGMYLATAWVVSVMLPPMAIFFPLFTLLEDFGYLPRVAFNLDRLFRAAGAHGKQALTLSMGYGCNAAGVIATRIIDSPRERLIAILTNNFSLCNGRWPTQILMASLFIAPLAPAWLAGPISALAVVGVTLLGVFFTLVVSWGLSRTVLKGAASAFSLELPPYRPPRFWSTLYTSLVDRTLFVLWRAVVFALPAGALTWLLTAVHWGDMTLAQQLVGLFQGPGLLIGLNGVILLAYVIAIPANELVIPSILLLTVHLAAPQRGVILFELDDPAALHRMLTTAGWTFVTGLNLMLFSLLHNPCSTTLYTIYKETGSWRWTALSALIPLVLGVLVCGAVAWVLG